MKRLLLLLFFIPFISLAQVPQGVGYQGVATDASGIELVNQAISIRASVLSASATGNVEWEETHATSTDTFGLFTLTIGQGTNTTNGAQSSFADISWGTNTYFLKIEMDVTGGSTYSNMGTNQMMSVPYALFAESANINYDSISNLLSNDSTFITNVGGGMGGGGCDFSFPDGLDGEGVSIDVTQSNPYSVPTGKRLYLLSWTASSPVINGLFDYIDLHTGQPLILNSGQSVSPEDPNVTSRMNGFLVPENNNVQVISIDVTQSNPYSVPIGKRLYLLNWTGSPAVINGLSDFINLQAAQPLILNSGQSVSPEDPNLTSRMNGYLADENYFAGCGGGGGSSSTSSLDSTAIANMIAASGGGCDFQYPEGLDGVPVNWMFSDGPYTVPLGKRFYLSNVGSPSSPTILVDGDLIEHSTNDGVVLVSENQIITQDNITENISGLLVNAKAEITNIITTISDSTSFTVPNDKIFVFKNGGPASNILLNGNNLHQSDITNFYFFKEGDIISRNGPSYVMSGYLADENYFAGCGGGGGGSSTNSSSSNSAIGVGSAVDLNDFDKEDNLFDAQISWLEDRFVIDVDEDHNVYLATDYNVNVNHNNTIGGQSLYYESSSSDRSIAIAKYDSTGAIQYVQSISLNPDESYEVTDCDLDANGDFLVTGRKFATTNNFYSIFFRKYDNSGNLLFEHVSVPNNGNCNSWKIISDGSGGAYICGDYTEDFDLGNGALLPEDNNKRKQGYIARFDQNGNVLWSDYMGVTTHSASGAGWYDQAQSLALDANGNILVAGQIDTINTGTIGHQHFIRKYDSSGTLLDEQLSSNYDANISEKNGIRITVDNNGDIYLYTHHPITQQYPSTHTYSFNGLTLDPINGSSQILYKLSSTFTPIYAKNFGVASSAYLYQIISLDSDNIVMRPNSNGPYIIDNIIYSQDINQQSVLLELSGNAEFVKYHTLGNNLGSTVPIHIASNSNSTFILYKRDGSFINNSITYPSGYYIVREEY